MSSRAFVFWYTHLANILQRTKRTNPETKATPRHVIACVWIFGNPSCLFEALFDES